MSGIGGSQEYRLSIIVEGQDKASAPLGGVGGALGGIAQIAAGILSAGILQRIASQIIDMGRSAIQATADYQSMQVGLEALLAREISRGQVQEQLVAQSVNLTATQRLKMIELTRTISDQTESLSQLQEQFSEVSTSQGAGSEAALKLQIQIEKMTSSIGSANTQLADLTDRSDGTTMALQAITTGAMSIAEAMPQAQARARELLGQIRLLAIQSPFELTTIQNTFKMGMAFGFTANESLAFTRGLMNVAAGVGASSEMLDRMAYNLAQVRMQGRVTAVDVRQLAMAGFDLNGALKDIGKQFGYTIEDYQGFNELIEEGKISWADFATSFESYADTQFGGASRRLSETWSGMMSNIRDVWNLSMPQVLGPAMEQVTGFLNGLMQKFITFTNSGKLEEWGEKIGEDVTKAIEFIERLIALKDRVKIFFDEIFNGVNLQAALKSAFDISIPPEFQGIFDSATSTVETFLEDIKSKFGAPVQIKSFDDLQTRIDTFNELTGTFGIDWQTALQSAFGIVLPPELLDVINTVTGFVDDIKGALEDAKPILDTAFDKFGEFWATNGPGITQALSDIQQVMLTIDIETFKKLFEISGEQATNEIGFFAQAFQNFATWIVENGPTIQEFLVKTGDFLRFLGEVFRVVFTIIGGVLQVAWAIIEPILSGLFTIIGDSVAWLMRTFSSFITAIELLFSGDLSGAFTELISIVRDTFSTMWNIVTTIFNMVIEAIIGAFNTILGWFGIKMQSLHTTWSEKWNLIKDFVTTLWEDIKTSISTKFTEIITNIGQFLIDAIQKITDKIADWKQIGKDMIQGFFDGISEKVEEVKTWLEDQWQAIVDLTRRIFDEQSPSKVFMNIGKNIMLGLGIGVTDNAAFPKNAVMSASEAVTQAIPNTYTNQSSTSTSSYKIDINVNGSNDPEKVAKEIMGLLKLQGVMI